MGGAGASLFCSSVYIYMYISPLSCGSIN
jgi:hypothetical protein